MPKLPVLPAKDVLDWLLRYGCVLVSVRGSHHKVENPANGRRAPVPVHGSRELDGHFLRKILLELGIDVDDFIRFIS